MAKATKGGKKPAQTLRQKTSEQAAPKKRRLREPVRKVSTPFRKAKSAASKGFLGKVGRVLIPKYFRESWRELKEVTWPDRKQTAKLTFAVIVFAVAFGAAIAVVDYGLDKLFRQLLLS